MTIERLVPYCDRFRGTLGYSDNPMNPPPAEKKPNVIQLELTTGCSHSACTFCTMYGRRDQFAIKPIAEYKDHVDEVMRSLEQNPDVLRRIDRIFIGSGDALAVETHYLIEATMYTYLSLMRAQKSTTIPRRAALYGNTRDILKHGSSGLKALRCGGYCSTGCSIDLLGDRRAIELVFWGLESGNSEALRMAGKGYDHDMAALAADKLRRSNIRPSVMIMPGLGGQKYFNEHIFDTGRILRIAQPEFITFIGLKSDNTPLARIMEKQESNNENRRLSDILVVEQTARMIEQINFPTTIGVHGNDVHTFGYNPVPMGTFKIEDYHDARRIANRLRQTGNLFFSLREAGKID